MGSTGVYFVQFPLIHRFFLSHFSVRIFSFSKCHRWSLEGSFHSDMKEPTQLSQSENVERRLTGQFRRKEMK